MIKRTKTITVMWNYKRRIIYERQDTLTKDVNETLDQIREELGDSEFNDDGNQSDNCPL